MYKIILTLKDTNKIEMQFNVTDNIEIQYMMATNDIQDAQKLQVNALTEDFQLRSQWELIKYIDAANIESIAVTVYDKELYFITEPVTNIMYLLNFTKDHIIECLTFNLAKEG